MSTTLVHLCADLASWAALASSAFSAVSAKLWWDASRLRMPSGGMAAGRPVKLQQVSVDEAFSRIDAGLAHLGDIEHILVRNSRANAHAALYGMGATLCGAAALALQFVGRWV